jgi:oxygen-independent coproporphyrinogen III oxidase
LRYSPRRIRRGKLTQVKALFISGAPSLRMREDLLRRYGGPAPRYTSYPTAPHFHTGMGAADYRAWLGELDSAKPLSLYIHVPFCAELCWYCGCHTKVVRGYRPIADYAALLAKEIELVCAAIPFRATLAHLHWGGGTPSMLSDADFLTLMRSIAERFHLASDIEVAVEIDPRILSESTVRTLAESGVTRASLGVQDFDSKVQEAVHRIQPFETTARAVEWLRGKGIAAINFDLMYGLPEQTQAGIERTVDLAATLAPDRIALFGYAHVPWMKRHQNLIDATKLPDAKARFQAATAAHARLLAHGFRPIGLDHFARPGDALLSALETGALRRNFQGYTTDNSAAVIGFGASAIGSLPQGYVQNQVGFRAYAGAVRGDRLATARGIRLSPEDAARRAVIERLMCDLGVDLSCIARDFGLGPTHFAAEVRALAPMVADGLLTVDGTRLQVAETGRPFLRSIAAVFDRYLAKAEVPRHSRAI